MVYQKDGNRIPKFVKNYFTIEFGGNHQQIFRLTLSPVNKLVNEVEYCARIFSDKKNEKDIKINFFEDQKII
ncbi:hypothetical protein BpHYR1_008937 [Brachionus plicatilis]|uniref:Uncharacterized protein n=1 Tax=Brachionus plicatilis TaxID=10195 RepID=A0A3M7RKN1_BRAPC|nr:hypothetical protein BpHYR1_008937 [Brachionus plicatilis]